MQVLWLFVVKANKCRLQTMHSRYTSRKLNLNFVFNPIWAWNRKLNNFVKDVITPYNRKYPQVLLNTSVNLLMCSFHRSVIFMLFFRSCQTSLRSRYGYIQRYGALTSFTSFLFTLIGKKVSKYELFQIVKSFSGTLLSAL